MALQFQVLAGEYAVCRFAPTEPIPAWAQPSVTGLLSITRTPGELSIVGPTIVIPAKLDCARGWRVITLIGPFPLEAVGVLAPVVVALSRAKINVFVVSTYDTDWILIPAAKLEHAIAALEGAGCELVSS
jgi:hypothetical protein